MKKKNLIILAVLLVIALLILVNKGNIRKTMVWIRNQYLQTIMKEEKKNGNEKGGTEPGKSFEAIERQKKENFANRTDGTSMIPDPYNTGTVGELADFLTLYPDAYIQNNVIFITNEFVNKYGNVLGNFKLDGYTLYFKDPVGDMKIYNAEFMGNDSQHYAVQEADEYANAGNVVTLEYCEGSNFLSAFNNGRNFTFRNCYVHDMYQDAFKADNNVIIENSYVRGCGTSKDAHADGVQVTSNSTPGINIELSNTRFEQPFVAGKYYENACVFIKLVESANGNIKMSNLYMNGGNYTLYILQDENKDYSNMHYQVENLYIGDSARYGKTSFANNLSDGVDINNLDNLYVGSVFKKDGKVYISANNDSSQEKTLRVVTENEETEFALASCVDGSEQQENIEYSELPIDVLCEVGDCKTISCYDGDALIGQFEFKE